MSITVELLKSYAPEKNTVVRNPKPPDATVMRAIFARLIMNFSPERMKDEGRTQGVGGERALGLVHGCHVHRQMVIHRPEIRDPAIGQISAQAIEGLFRLCK